MLILCVLTIYDNSFEALEPRDIIGITDLEDFGILKDQSIVSKTYTEDYLMICLN